MMFGFTTQQIFLFVVALLFSMLVTMTIVLLMIVRIPADYFVSEHDELDNVRSTALRIALRIGRNLLGVVLVCMGVVLSIPGVPGQGLLTILVGLLLLDIPGKRKLLLRLVRRTTVLRALNRLRARYEKEPLVVDRDVVEP